MYNSSFKNQTQKLIIQLLKSFAIIVMTWKRTRTCSLQATHTLSFFHRRSSYRADWQFLPPFCGLSLCLLNSKWTGTHFFFLNLSHPRMMCWLTLLTLKTLHSSILTNTSKKENVFLLIHRFESGLKTLPPAGVQTSSTLLFWFESKKLWTDLFVLLQRWFFSRNLLQASRSIVLGVSSSRCFFWKSSFFSGVHWCVQGFLACGLILNSRWARHRWKLSIRMILTAIFKRTFK